jgi:hypothetical protein
MHFTAYAVCFVQAGGRVDEHNHAVPVGHVIFSNEQETTFEEVMWAVRAQVEKIQPDFAPSNFSIDDCAALANAVQ